MSSRTPGVGALPFLLLCLLLCLLTACGGPPLATKAQAAASMTRASIPSTQAQGAALDLYSSHAFPPAGITLQGARGGSATVTLNPVEIAVGLAGKGLLLDIRYQDYSEDGIYRLEGLLSVLAQFNYVAEAQESPHADLKLTLAGKVKVSGVYSDEVRAHLTVLTRLHPLSLRDGEVDVQLNGSLEASQTTFQFSGDSYTLAWGDAPK